MKGNDMSDGIVVSFHSKWLPILSRGAIKYVFRKRGPQNMNPKWMYVYVGSPTKAVVGRLPVTHVDTRTLRDCVGQASGGAITADELNKYADGYERLFVFTVGHYQAAARPASLAALSSKHRFVPPQSFLVLSIPGARVLDEMCKFGSGKVASL